MPRKSKRLQKQEDSTLSFNDTLLQSLLSNQDIVELHQYLREFQEIIDLPKNSLPGDFHRSYSPFHLFEDKISYSGCLNEHQIGPEMRGKMVDWLIEVFNVNRPCLQTYFKTIHLIDYFLKSTRNRYSGQDLYLIGITCLYIASKTEEVHHISLQSIVSEIGHRRFSDFQVKAQEKLILKTLDFDVNFPTTLDCLEFLLITLFQTLSNSVVDRICQAAKYALRIVVHDYDLIQYDPMDLAASIIVFVLQTFPNQISGHRESIQVNQVLMHLQQKVVEYANATIPVIQSCVMDISYLVDNFQSKYPNFHNLRKLSQ